MSATPSEVKAGLDAVSEVIAEQRNLVETAQQVLANVVQVLDEVPTEYADVIAQIDLYAPTGAFEELAKDELSKLTAEFQALRAKAQAAATA